MSHTQPQDAREVEESPLIQGVWEARAYSFDFTDCGVTDIDTPAAALYLSGEDVTASHISGSASVAGLVVTTPPVANLEAGKVYHLHGRVTHDGGQKTELYARIIGRA